MLVTSDETGNLDVVDKDNGDSARVDNDSSIEKPSNESILIVIRSPARLYFKPLKITRYTKRFKAWTKLVKNREVVVVWSFDLNFLRIHVFPVKMNFQESS